MGTQWLCVCGVLKYGMTIKTSPELFSLLHDLIGTQGQYQDTLYTLIEVIKSDPMVVLEPIKAENIIQNTYQGEAKRYALKNYSIPLFSEVNKGLHPVLKAFLGQEITQLLEEQIRADQ